MINKLTFIFLIFHFFAANAQDEKLLIHFNNAEDRTSMEQAIRDLIKVSDFTGLASESANPETEIQLIFFDPSVSGILEVIEIQTSSNQVFIDKWKELHNEKDRILFLFTKSNGKYDFTLLATSDLIAEGQLPDIVRNHIEQKIIKSQSTYQEAITEGINALLNAYDQKYKNTLVSTGTQMLTFPKYYKGNCYPESLIYCNDFESSHINNPIYYRFQLQENNTRWDEELPVERLTSGSNSSNYLSSPYYYNGPFERVRTVDYHLNNTALLFGYAEKAIYGAGTKHIRLNKVSSAGSVELIEEADLYYYKSGTDIRTLNSPSVNAEYLEVYDTDAGVSIDFASVKREFDSHSPDAYQAVKSKINQALANAQHEQSHNRYSFCRLRLPLFRVDQGKELPQGALKLYYSNSQPTWCNVYARDLMEDMFGYEILPYKSANEMAAFLLGNTSDFIPLDLSKTDKVWNLINNGYTVVFSYNNPGGHGHIELGHPDEGGNKYMTIGAGAKVKKKSWTAPKNSAVEISFGGVQKLVKAYLFIGYINFAYEK